MEGVKRPKKPDIFAPLNQQYWSLNLLNMDKYAWKPGLNASFPYMYHPLDAWPRCDCEACAHPQEQPWSPFWTAANLIFCIEVQKIAAARENRLVTGSQARIYRPAETWPSGRRRSPAKGVGGKPSRGFESLRLRHPPFLFNCVRCGLAPYGAVFVRLSSFVVAIEFSSIRLVSVHCVV